ncbi:tetratricopeptide repeat protein [Labilibaculum euxinus]|uniref:Tetratricopeptide repeat protein n=1 Tax=Labilibaculum euxinus TaxID=2686357 RepID=A0A7M4D8K5_9BACT|nr:tetratricopeptide repeat protein [Labilibaculum euxinus]MUP38984.1 tetratricopeptide repeat protein [Labilibaculum euxinus]MVB08189.1 tetratricopeptide repeat protein [Labilibaculum euxinus]
MNKYIALFIGLLCLFSLDALAQKERKFIRKGNGLFEGNEYENSEVEYRKALDKKINSYEAGFNLGDALYKQKKYDEALKQYQALTATEKDPKKLGEIYHNIGNTLLMNRKIDESIEAYKESLRNFPNSKETKYNLEYAKKMKQKEEEKKKKQDQNKDQNKNQDKKDQNKDQNKKDQNKKDQDKKDQDKKDQDKKDQKDKPENQDKKKGDPEEQQNKISEQDAKRLLEALENDEKKVQEKVQKAKAVAQKAKRSKIKKDW